LKNGTNCFPGLFLLQTKFPFLFLELQQNRPCESECKSANLNCVQKRAFETIF
jgi:hypothetical protein